MLDHIDELESAVCDEESFLRFLLALSSDREDSVAKEAIKPSSPYGPDANGWENTTIESFLFASVRWAQDSVNGLPLADYVPSSNPWRRCAEILHAGKIYE
jgi:hypothetical protein